MNDLSKIMKFFMKLGSERIAWSLRRLHCPVKKDDLVLEVGSGGNPYFRSNVLVDAYEETRERHWAPLVSDRPTVLGFVENLPFKDNSFDFVIASHVLEHSNDPEKFISELQRVAKSGYIEVPDAFMERVNPYRDHRLEITVRDDELVIRKKAGWQADPELVEIYEDRVKKILTNETMPQHPFSFHVRYYWTEKIGFSVVNPQVDSKWAPPESHVPNITKTVSFRRKANKFILGFAGRLFSQHQRNNNINIKDLLMCTVCKSDSLCLEDDALVECKKCEAKYLVNNGIPVMTSPVK